MSSPLAAILNLTNELPAGPLPPGATQNFYDGGGGTSLIVNVSTVCMAVSTFVMAIRIYTRSVIIKVFGAEDWLALLGWVACVALYAVSLVDVSHKGAWHQYDLHLSELSTVLYWDYIATIPVPIACAVVRISILVQYLRIFQPRSLGRGPLWWVSWALIIIMVIYTLIILAIITFMCTPREKIWQPFEVSGKCLSERDVDLWGVILNMIFDVAILVIPQPCIWRLKMNLRRKLGVSALFLIGLFAVICSVAKFYYVIIATRTSDMLYNNAILAMWTYPELTFCILGSCLPSLAKFCRTMLDKHRANSKIGDNGLVLSPNSPPLRAPSPQSSSGPSTPRKPLYPVAMGQVFIPPTWTPNEQSESSDSGSGWSVYSSESGRVDGIGRELAALGAYHGSLAGIYGRQWHTTE